MTRTSTVVVMGCITGVVLLAWSLQSGKLPARWAWAHKFGSSGQFAASGAEHALTAPRSASIFEQGVGPESIKEKGRNRNDGGDANPGAKQGPALAGLNLPRAAKGSASNFTGPMPRDSTRASLVAVVVDQTKRNLALFSKVVPVDENTADQLIAAKASYAETDADILQSAQANNLSPSDTRTLRAQAAAELQQTYVALLGPQDGQTFVELDSGSRFDPIVDDFASRVAAAGEPLSAAAQIAVTINLSNNLRDPLFPTQPTVLSSLEQQALNSAAKVLSPTQLVIFKQLWSEHPFPKVGLK